MAKQSSRWAARSAVACVATSAWAAAGAFGAACSSSSSDDTLDSSVYFGGSDAGVATDAHPTPAPDATTRGGDDAASTGGDDASGTNGDAGPGDDGDDAAIDAGRDYGTDAATFSGASRCATANVLLCDGFEDGAIDTTTWTVSASDSERPAVSTAQAARGSGSLHILLSKVSGGYESETITESKTFPVANNHYFGRVFLRFHQLPAAPLTYQHWTFAAATGPNIPADIRLSGQFNNNGAGKNLFGVGTDETGIDGGTGDWTQQDNDPASDPTAVPLDKWMCIEWENDGSTNETSFWWDGIPHPSMHTTSTISGSTTGKPYILPQFASQWIGLEAYHATTEAMEAYLDEVAIDTQRIGCNL